MAQESCLSQPLLQILLQFPWDLQQSRTEILSSILAGQILAVLLWRPLFIKSRPPYTLDR